MPIPDSVRLAAARKYKEDNAEFLKKKRAEDYQKNKEKVKKRRMEYYYSNERDFKMMLICCPYCGIQMSRGSIPNHIKTMHEKKKQAVPKKIVLPEDHPDFEYDYESD